jgi:hypothetical protein
MSVELHAGEAAGEPADAGLSAREDRRPNVSGDLPTVLQAGPMFRRAAVGYDRFQVDTYVRWAEDELVASDREREHLVTRCLRLQADLEESRQLLSHSSGGAEFLQISRRIGALLATAADEAESLRADAQADRSAASAEAEQTIAQAEQFLADAKIEAERHVAYAVLEAAGAVAEAERLAAEVADRAERLRREARAEAASRLESVRVVEQRAAEQAEQLVRQAGEAAAAALVQARGEVVRMLGVAREERRRADAEAAAERERRDADALARSASLRAEVTALERRRTRLRAEIRRLAASPTEAMDAPVVSPLSRLAETLHWRSRSLRAP